MEMDGYGEYTKSDEGEEMEGRVCRRRERMPGENTVKGKTKSR